MLVSPDWTDYLLIVVDVALKTSQILSKDQLKKKLKNNQANIFPNLHYNPRP